VKHSASRRVHPASLAVLWFQDLRPWLLPLGALLLFSIGDSERLVWAWLLLPTMFWRLWHFLTLRYAVDGAGLWIHEGVIERTERRVLAERITHIAREQPALARLFGLWELKLETSSGGAPEAVLKYVSLHEAERIAELLGQAHQGPSSAVPEAIKTGPELRLSIRELLYLGFFAGRGWALAIGGYALANEIGLLDLLPLDRFDVEVDEGRVGVGLRHLVLLMGLLLLVKLLALVDTVLRYGGYSLNLSAGRLEFRTGLLTRHEARLEPRQLMRLALESGPLDRWLNRSRLRVDIAGAGDPEDRAQTTVAQTLVPTFKLSRWPVLQTWLGLAEDPRALTWRKPAKLYLRKERYESWCVALALGGLVAIWYPWVGPIATGGLLLAGELYVRRLGRVQGFALVPSGLWLQGGLLERSWIFLPRQRLEVAHLRQSPWKRRFGLWDLELDSPHAQGIGEVTTLEGLAPEVAREVLNHLGLRPRVLEGLNEAAQAPQPGHLAAPSAAR
jgi:putative membrane protein